MSPDLSVVVAAASGDEESLRQALAAIQASCHEVRTELILVGLTQTPGSPPGSAPVVAVACPAEELTPLRWGRGLECARAPHVAFTTDEFRVCEPWAPTLLRALARGAAGAAGTIGLARPATPTALATYLIRYSAFLPGMEQGESVVHDIPGDTAMYRRDLIMQHPDLVGRGFWEVEFHRRFRADGRALLLLPETLAEYTGAPRLGGMLRQRFRHGMEFGGIRVRQRGEAVWRVAVPAPAVPFVLGARVARRLHTVGGGLAPLLRGGPALLALGAAWAAGEALGAMRGARA